MIEEKIIDNVNTPEHYKREGYECIEAMEDFNLIHNGYLMNAFKYIWRAGIKDPSKLKEDLDKAVWYIHRYFKNTTAFKNIGPSHIPCDLVVKLYLNVPTEKFLPLLQIIILNTPDPHLKTISVVDIAKSIKKIQQSNDKEDVVNPISCRFEVKEYSILDKTTNLEWQKVLSSKQYTWQEAKNYCKTLGDGWRLPMIKELISLFDYDSNDNLGELKEIGFKNSQSYGYWSGGTFAPSTMRAWYVNMNYGSVYYDYKSSSYYVLAVKGEKKWQVH